ncbi:YbaN family protein [Faucicola mancuniensis]|uniref:YbaN family protein n=1 Tax=Faucicola mancuniensis TaxID=1309795 RepID=UPI0028E9BE97|nr:YbaN family protein [uncultured Moraxella sp.]
MSTDFQQNPPTPSHDSIQPTHLSIWQKMLRWIFFGLGFLFLGLGFVGIFLPVLPTTPFIILATGCFAKSSERFHQWLLNHKTFGKLIKNWQERRAIPRYAKYLAWTMMTLSCAMLFYRLSHEMIWLACTTSTVCLLTTIWMARLPDA